MQALAWTRMRLFVFLVALLSTTTAYAQCEVPFNLSPTVKDVAIDTVTLRWANKTSPKQYQIYVALGKTPPTPGVDTPVNPKPVDGSNRSYPISGLKKGSVYTWLVVAECTKANESPSAAAQFQTTTCSVPTSPKPIDGEKNVSTIVTLQWSAVPNASKYNVYAKIGSSTAIPKLLGTTESAQLGNVKFPSDTVVYWYVEVTSTDGCPSNRRDPVDWVFSTISCMFDPPEQVDPPNASTQPSSVKFVWKAVAGADDYGLFTSVNGGAYNEKRVGNVTSVAGNFASDSKVYWYVRAYPSNGCDPVDSTNETYFVTEKACASGNPRLLAPANGAGGVASPVTFKWDGVAGADSYELFAAENGSTKYLSLGKTTANGLVRSVAGVVSWYVESIFPGECPRGRSETWKFEVPDTSCPTQGPSLVSPADKASVTSPVVFEWSSVAASQKYSLQLRKAGSTDAFMEFASTTSTKTEIKLDSGELEWRVQAFPDRCDPVFSSTRLVAVKEASTCGSNNPTDLVSPEDGSEFATDVIKFTWNPVAGSAGYDLQVSGDGGGTWKTLGSTIENGIVATVPSGKLLWRVLTKFSGCAPLASLTRTINVSISKCSTTPPELVAPPLGATVPSPVLLQWSPVVGADGYSVFASIDGDSPVNITGLITETSYEAALPAGTIVWFVEAVSKECGSSYSAKSKFLVSKSGACPTAGPDLISPANGATGVPRMVTFEWAAVSGATSYEVVVSIDGGAAVSLGQTKELSLTREMKGEKIGWYVIAIAPGCDPIASNRFAFGLAADDSCSIAAPSRILPADNTTDVSPVVFQWTSSGQGTYYRLWVARDGGPEVVLAETLDTVVKRHIEPGSYTWFVEAFRKGCRLSAKSSRGRFAVVESDNCTDDAPVPLSPTDGSTLTDPEVVFNWSPVEGAIAYELWLSRGDGVETLMRVTRDTSEMLVMPEGKFQWFVRALFNGCEPKRSQTLTFAVDLPDSCQGRPPFILSPPIDELAELANPVLFSWTPATGGTGPVNYIVWASVEDSEPIKIGETADTSLKAELPSGRVTWFVSATRPGCPSVNSSRGVFVVASAEECGEPRSPVVRAVLEAKSGQPYEIRWLAGPNTSSFIVEESTSPEFTTVETQVVVDTLATYVHDVEAPTRFFYRVSAISDCDDRRSLPSETVSVVVRPREFRDSSKVDNVEPLGTSGQITIPIVISGPTSKTTSETTFTAATSQPWMSVSPSSGTIPPEGLTLNITADLSNLGPGANTGSLVIDTNESAGKSTSDGSTTTPVTVSLVAPVSPTSKSGPKPESLMFPAVGHAAGFNSQWQSDVRLTNISAQATNYLLYFTQSGQAGTGTVGQASLTVSPGETVALDDVVKSWFGIGADGSSATGTLEVRPQSNAITTTSSSSLANGTSLASGTVASSRTYNLSAGGTFGQFIPAVAFANFAGPGEAISLQQVSQSDQFRTNIGVVEGAGEEATVQFSVFTNDGQMLDQWTETLQPGEQRQYDQVIAQRGLTLEGGRVELELVSETGKITGYGSTVDNLTGDPTFITPVNKSTAPANQKLVVAGVADLDNGVASWRTDVRLYNAGSSSESVTLNYYAQGNSTPTASTQVTIEAGGVLEANDILKSTFGITNSGGAVHIETDGDAQIIPTARTYNRTEAGTYGQFIPAVSPEQGARVGSSPLQLLQVEQSANFRTNVGFAELSGNQATVEVVATVPGALVAPIKQYTLAPNEFRQVNVILNDMGISEAYNARLSIRVIDGGGSVSAYASVVDSSTQDPTYVPAQ